MGKILISLLLFTLSGCDWSTHMINKLSGQEDENSDGRIIYHEERTNSFPDKS